MILLFGVKFSCSCYFSYPLAYFPPLVFPSIVVPFLSPSLCVSRLIVFTVAFFALIPPLFHLLFSSPPPAALEKENNGKNNYIILFASGVSLQKYLSKILVFFVFLSEFLSTKHVCLIFLEYVLREQGII